jgi:hypothetical protein
MAIAVAPEKGVRQGALSENPPRGFERSRGRISDATLSGAQSILALLGVSPHSQVPEDMLIPRSLTRTKIDLSGDSHSSSTDW